MNKQQKHIENINGYEVKILEITRLAKECHELIFQKGKADTVEQANILQKSLLEKQKKLYAMKRELGLIQTPKKPKRHRR